MKGTVVGHQTHPRILHNSSTTNSQGNLHTCDRRSALLSSSTTAGLRASIDGLQAQTVGVYTVSSGL